MKELTQRLIYGTISLGLLILFVFLSPLNWFKPIFGIALALVACTAQWEYYGLAMRKNFRPIAPFAIGCGIFYLLVQFLQTLGRLPDGSTFFALGLILFAIFCLFCATRDAALGNVSVSFFGIVYTILPLGLFFELLYRPAGWWWFFFAIVPTVATDMGAYFVGKALGRHKLAPTISPGKTLEGGIGGLIVGTAAAFVWWLFGTSQMTIGHAIVMGVILAVVGQIADLSESLLKRDADVKDSGQIPGLGGMLDVVDSLLFNVPVVYLYLRILG